MASPAIKLPPGAELVEEGPKLPPGAELVTDTPSTSEDLSFKGVGKAFLKQGVGMVKALGSQVENVADIATLGAKPVAEKLIPKLGKARQQREAALKPASPEEQTGKTILETGEMFVPIPGVQEIKAGAGAGRLMRLGASAARGAADVGLKTAVQTGDVSEAGKTAVAGGVAGGVTEAAAKPFSQWLSKAARSQYLKVLHPLGRKAKEASEVVVKEGGGDDLVRRGVTGWSKEALRDRFVSEAEATGKALEAEYAKLDATKREVIGPIFNDFAQWLQKETTTPQGHLKAGAKTLIDEANEQAKLIFQLGNDAAPSELWHIRRSLDKYIFKNLTADQSLAAANEVRQGLATSIRSHLNSNNPTIQDLNKEYHLWQTASELIHRNIQNERGKLEFAKNTGAIGRFLMGAAIGGGEAAREGHTSPLELGTAAVLLGSAMSSTKWRTVSAIQKDKIAELLARDPDAAANLAARLTGVATMPFRK